MKPEDYEGFFGDPAELDPESYLLLDYQLECSGDPRLAAARFCSEQSTAQWRRVGFDEDLRRIHGAKVLELEVEQRLAAFSYPVKITAHPPIYRCRLKIAHPTANFGARLPNLMSAVCGEGVFFTPGIPIVRLLDITFPKTFLAQFEGPQFGLAGVRDRLAVHDRPILFGVIKPNLGLTPDAMAELAYQAWVGGLDIAKDDELLGDIPWCPLQERAAKLGSARQRAEAVSGERKTYLANITDEVDRICGLHDVAVAKGTGAVMVNALPVGLSGIRMLRRHAEVPIVAHFPLIAASSRLPHFGVSSRVFTRLQRLAGCDVVIMPGLGERMMGTTAEVMGNVAACLEPMGPIAPCLPVPGGSDWAGTLGPTYRLLGTIDFGFVPGRGVFGHPMGPAAGAASLRQAWQAEVEGIDLATAAQSNRELRVAIETFGPVGPSVSR